MFHCVTWQLCDVMRLHMVRIGLCCHGILQAGFQSMFSKTTGRKTDARPTRDILRALAIDDANDADGCNTDQNLAVPDGSESPFVFPDVPVQKVQGVRANKSETWLRRPTTVAEVITAISTTEPVFRLSTWYLQQQESEGWLSSNPDMRPLVNLVTRQYSPVTKAISQCICVARTLRCWSWATVLAGWFLDSNSLLQLARRYVFDRLYSDCTENLLATVICNSRIARAC